MGTVNINIVIQLNDRNNTYLDIVYNDFDFCYKTWVPPEYSHLLEMGDPFSYNESEESYTNTMLQLGDPCITLIRFED